jgi:hypothetical protein
LLADLPKLYDRLPRQRFTGNNAGGVEFVQENLSPKSGQLRAKQSQPRMSTNETRIRTDLMLKSVCKNSPIPKIEHSQAISLRHRAHFGAGEWS